MIFKHHVMSSVAASVSSSSMSWWRRSCLSLLSVLLLHFCLTSPRLINSAARIAYRSAAGLDSVWGGTFSVCPVMSVCFGIVMFVTFESSFNAAAATTLILCHVRVSVWVICVCVFIFINSWWLPVSTRDGSTNEQTAFQLFSRPPFTGERWEREKVSPHEKKLQLPERVEIINGCTNLQHL